MRALYISAYQCKQVHAKAEFAKLAKPAGKWLECQALMVQSTGMITQKVWKAV